MSFTLRRVDPSGPAARQSKGGSDGSPSPSPVPGSSARSHVRHVWSGFGDAAELRVYALAVIPGDANAGDVLHLGGAYPNPPAATFGLQSIIGCPASHDPCATDIDGDGVTDFNDLFRVIAAWGPCTHCPEDLDGNGTVGEADIAALLAAWGPCP